MCAALDSSRHGWEMRILWIKRRRLSVRCTGPMLKCSNRLNMISCSLNSPSTIHVGTHSIYCYVLKFNATKSEAILHDISIRIESIFSPRNMPLEAFNINFIQQALFGAFEIARAFVHHSLSLLFEFQWQKKENVNGGARRLHFLSASDKQRMNDGFFI